MCEPSVTVRPAGRRPRPLCPPPFARSPDSSCAWRSRPASRNASWCRTWASGTGWAGSASRGSTSRGGGTGTSSGASGVVFACACVQPVSVDGKAERQNGSKAEKWKAARPKRRKAPQRRCLPDIPPPCLAFRLPACLHSCLASCLSGLRQQHPERRSGAGRGLRSVVFCILGVKNVLDAS